MFRCFTLAGLLSISMLSAPAHAQPGEGPVLARAGPYAYTAADFAGERPVCGRHAGGDAV